MSASRRCRHGTSAINFDSVNAAALPCLPSIVRRWLPDGRRWGFEWVARNPKRPDKNLGSFKINLHSGRWSDFATGAAGGDAVSLAAYLFGLSQTEAAQKIAAMLSIGGGGQ